MHINLVFSHAGLQIVAVMIVPFTKPPYKKYHTLVLLARYVMEFAIT